MAADADDDPTPPDPGSTPPDPIEATIINTGLSAAAVERALSRRAKDLAHVDDTLEHVQEILDEL